RTSSTAAAAASSAPLTGTVEVRDRSGILAPPRNPAGVAARHAMTILLSRTALRPIPDFALDRLPNRLVEAR
ncbi:MAG: hypothetical protein AB1744_16030, partial [Candidatus Zixiibacteriota bacterium]